MANRLDSATIVERKKQLIRLVIEHLGKEEHIYERDLRNLINANFGHKHSFYIHFRIAVRLLRERGIIDYIREGNCFRVSAVAVKRYKKGEFNASPLI